MNWFMLMPSAWAASNRYSCMLIGIRTSTRPLLRSSGREVVRLMDVF
jgi:hypothetical protein